MTQEASARPRTVAGEGLKGSGYGAVDVLGVLLVLLGVADVDVRAGGELALGEFRLVGMASLAAGDLNLRLVAVDHSGCLAYTIKMEWLNHQDGMAKPS